MNASADNSLQLIASKQPASAKYDRLRFVCADGSQVEIDMPRQGALPHERIHRQPVIADSSRTAHYTARRP